MEAIDNYVMWVLSCDEKVRWPKGLQEVITERINIIDDPKEWERHKTELYANAGWYCYYMDSVSRKAWKPYNRQDDVSVGEWPPAKQLGELVRTARKMKVSEEYEDDVKLVLSLVAKVWIDELTPQRLDDEHTSEG